ncbi:MAG: hypothetical protein HRF49_00880 [bacterium]
MNERNSQFGAPIPVLMGPTGSGKTAAAVALARDFPLTAIPADLRQVMRGMEIGSAQPSADELSVLPHKLLGACDPKCDLTVHGWREMALGAIAEVVSEGRIPIIVGGSGLCVKSLAGGMEYDAPAAPVLRPPLEAWVKGAGAAAVAPLVYKLIEGLIKPESFFNPHRITRAIERYCYLHRSEIASPLGGIAPPDVAAAAERQVVEWNSYANTIDREARPSGRVNADDNGSAENESNSGRALKGALPGTRLVGTIEYKIFALLPDRAWLAERIHTRAKQMFESGFIEEVRALLAAGVPRDARALLGHGYPEAIAVIDGKTSAAAAIERTAVITRQYAKRQVTWLRHQLNDVTFLPVGPDCPPEEAVGQIREWLLQH